MHPNLSTIGINKTLDQTNFCNSLCDNKLETLGGSKKTWIPTFPLGKQLSHFSCLGLLLILLILMILLEDDLSELLRGPAPKKRPMISGRKIKSADFYLPSRGYRILFKNEFLLFQFRFKPKILSRKLFPSDSSKIRPKISPRKKRFRNHYRNAK